MGIGRRENGGDALFLKGIVVGDSLHNREGIERRN